MTDRQQAALQELAAKSLTEIQQETALTWAHRAWAAYTYAAAANDATSRQAWLADAVELEHEAIEHAALADNGFLGGGCETFNQVSLIIASAKRLI